MSEAISFEVPWARSHRFDPPEVFDTLRQEGTLTRMVYPSGHLGWLATGYEAVRKVLSDPGFSHSLAIGHFPVTRAGAPIPQIESQPGMFIHMDPPDHTRYRRLLTAEFTSRRMAHWTDRVQQVAAEQIGVLREHGAPADLMEHFATPLVLQMLCELIGLPYAERHRFAHIPAMLHDPDGSLEDMPVAFGQVYGFIGEVIAAKREQPGDDLLSRLIEPGDLTDEELANLVILLLFAGYETTESALTVGVFALLEHPEQLAALRADPSRTAGAVEELLRYLTVNQYDTFRTATEDIEVDGRLVHKGETVTVSLPAANRDPAKFGCPAHLDLDRDSTGHVAFGYGVHQCLGQSLARIELRVGLATLLDAFPDLSLAVAADEVELLPRGSVFGVKALPVSW